MTIPEVIRKWGDPLPQPVVGNVVLIAGDGRSDNAAITIGEVGKVGVAGVRRHSVVYVKEKQILYADGTIAHPRRPTLVLPYAYFAKSIRERMREKAAHLAAGAHRYEEWAG